MNVDDPAADLIAFIVTAASRTNDAGDRFVGSLCVLLICALVLAGLFAFVSNRPEVKQRRAARQQRRRDKKPHWKPDPDGLSDWRWWDGTQFTRQISGRMGIDPETYEQTAVQNGTTLCPVDSKKQYLSQAAALTAANEIYEAKKARGDIEYKKNRAYHHYAGNNRRGCDCWHLTSQDS